MAARRVEPLRRGSLLARVRGSYRVGKRGGQREGEAGRGVKFRSAADSRE